MSALDKGQTPDLIIMAFTRAIAVITAEAGNSEERSSSFQRTPEAIKSQAPGQGNRAVRLYGWELGRGILRLLKYLGIILRWGKKEAARGNFHAFVDGQQFSRSIFRERESLIMAHQVHL